MISMRLLKRWSKERSDNYDRKIPFIVEPNPSLEDWTKAWHWELSHMNVVLAKKSNLDSDIFYMQSKCCSNKQISKEDIKNYKTNFFKRHIDNFDEYRNQARKIWMTTIHLEWSQRLKWHKNAKDVPLGESRKRGKPVTTKKASMIQPTDQVDVMEEIEAQEAKMEIQNEVEVENNSNENSAQSEIPKKKRGRPTGSKNKPKSIQDQPQNKRTKRD
ncbi:hypothetical protein BpHYR1_034188 [Brachionus plicatilis]|uniref:Uncharacterized protein n=1 Tax=Brachionus plicatilis TaxID=10195 RepID=A0A3M7RVW3_BRAPC|nr:hypothetical protein BpHYR1_034188 [Brachionus plicatilis]